MPKLSELKFKEYRRESFFATLADCWPKGLDKIVKYRKEYIYFNIKVTYDKGG